MIRNFKHQGLKQFYVNGSSRLLSPNHIRRIKRLLDSLDAADRPAALNYEGNYLHELKGERKGTWSVRVSGNWRLTFRFQNGNAYDVNLEDYH